MNFSKPLNHLRSLLQFSPFTEKETEVQRVYVACSVFTVKQGEELKFKPGPSDSKASALNLCARLCPWEGTRLLPLHKRSHAPLSKLPSGHFHLCSFLTSN